MNLKVYFTMKIQITIYLRDRPYYEYGKDNRNKKLDTAS